MLAISSIFHSSLNSIFLLSLFLLYPGSIALIIVLLSSTYRFSGSVLMLFLSFNSTNSASSSPITTLAVSCENVRPIGAPSFCILVSPLNVYTLDLKIFFAPSSKTFPITLLQSLGSVGILLVVHLSSSFLLIFETPGLTPFFFVLIGANSSKPHSLISLFDLAHLDRYLRASSISTSKSTFVFSIASLILLDPSSAVMDGYNATTSMLNTIRGPLLIYILSSIVLIAFVFICIASSRYLSFASM